ncbi:anti-sigma factor antagonist [Candidatus Riflebacteria bacterium]
MKLSEIRCPYCKRKFSEESKNCPVCRQSDNLADEDFIDGLGINVHEAASVTIFFLNGELTVDNCGHLRFRVEELLDEDNINYLFHLENLRYIDSAGVGTLTGILKNIEDAGGAMKLVSIDPKIEEVLDLLELSSLFEIYGDEKEAVMSFLDEEENS